MELQWPLIIFTALVAWSAGLFASQCFCSLKGEGKQAQMTAWIASAALLAVGGIAVFFHLEHWERIFNGFGHLSSGITQELIAIVVLAVVALVYLALLRKSEDGCAPAWIAITGIAASAVLVVVMAHSYMMAARPAWDTVFWIVAILGNACVLGPASMLLICAVKGDVSDESVMPKATFVGAALNGLGTLAYVVAAALGTRTLYEVEHYIDHTDPTETLLTAAQFGPFGDAVFAIIVAVVAVAAAVACAWFGQKKADWKLWDGAVVAAAFVGAIALRIAFYQMGASAFMIF